MMNKLTGVKDVDFMILVMLSDVDLCSICKVNKYIRSLCNDDSFWQKRVLDLFPINSEKLLDIKNYLEFDNWKEYYIFLIDRIEETDEYLIDNYTKRYSYIREKWLSKKMLKRIRNNLIHKEKFDNEIKRLDGENFPKWVNKVEFLKIVKRSIFTNQYLKEFYNHNDYLQTQIKNLAV